MQSEGAVRHSWARGPLSDLKVVDITQMLAGPYCSMLLADQGAEVIKIEPLGGEPTRRSGPFHDDDQLRAYGGYFQSVNRNKKSIVLDLKSTEGQEIVKALVADADILLENFRQGTMNRMGLSYETLSDINPRLVYGAIRGFGDRRSGESPYAEWPAYDVVAQAMGGILSVTGLNEDLPIKIGPGIGDLVPAMMMAFSLVSAVRHAEKTGCGQFVDVAMYDAILAICERMVYLNTFVGQVAKPEGNAHPMIAPFGLFPAADGWVAIACPREKFWERLARAMGRDDLATHPDYYPNASRNIRNAEVVELVSDWTRQHTKAELTEMLGGKVPFGPVQTVTEILADPQIAARNMLAEVDHPGVAEKVGIVNTPIHMTETQGGVHTRAPLKGEHTEEILQSIGFDAARISALRDAGRIE